MRTKKEQEKEYSVMYKKIFEHLDMYKVNSIEALSGLVNWSGMACDYIYDKWGEKEALRFVEFLGNNFLEDFYKDGGLEAIRKLRWYFDLEGAHTTYSENENSALLVIDKCNTGGRMTREGITRPCKNGMSVYCEHCPMWYDKMANKRGIQMTMEQKLNGLGCRFAYAKSLKETTSSGENRLSSQ